MQSMGGAARAGAVAMVLLVVTLAGAGAQDGAAAKWSGFSIGGEVGGAWSTQSWTMNPNYFNTLGPLVLGSGVDYAASNLVAGGHAGYSFAFGPVLLGAEVGVRSGGLNTQQPSPWFPATDVYKSEIHWMANAVARVGYAGERWLVYGKGGWAGGAVSFSQNDTNTGIVSTLDKWVNGWTAGAGADYMVFDRVSLGVSYDYSELTTSGITAQCPRCGTGVGFGPPVLDARLGIHAVMARFTYHFGP